MKSFKIENKKFQYNKSDEFFAGIFSIAYAYNKNLILNDKFNISQYLLCNNFDPLSFHFMDKKDFPYFIAVNSSLYGFNNDFIYGIYEYIENIHNKVFSERIYLEKYIQMYPFDREGNFFFMNYLNIPYHIIGITGDYKEDTETMDQKFNKYFRNLGFDDPEGSYFGNRSML